MKPQQKPEMTVEEANGYLEAWQVELGNLVGYGALLKSALSVPMVKKLLQAQDLLSRQAQREEDAEIVHKLEQSYNLEDMQGNVLYEAQQKILKSQP